MSIIQENILNPDYKNAALTSEQKIESIGDNLSKVNSELAFHQNELYTIKKGIVKKANRYYENANAAIKDNLIEAFQDMEWAFVTYDISSFCAAIYRQLEIFSNHCLITVKRCNDNIILDASGRNYIVGPAHFINSFPGWYVWDSTTRRETFVNFTNAADKQKYIEPFYLKTSKNGGIGVLNISFPNKLNLIVGLYINKQITNSGTSYYYINNIYSDITRKIKDIRDAREHGIVSAFLTGWTPKEFFDAFNVLHVLYQRIPDLH